MTPQEQRVPNLQEETGLPTFTAQRFKLWRAYFKDLPESWRVWGPSAHRPGEAQQAAQQGGAEFQHWGGAPPAGPLQVREVGEEREVVRRAHGEWFFSPPPRWKCF